MNRKNKILRALHEAEGSQNISVNKDDLADVISKTAGKDVNISVKDEMNEVESDDMYAEYIQDKKDEPRFNIGGKEFQYVWARYPDGKRDIGVYAYGEDRVYSIHWFQKNMLNQGQLKQQDEPQQQGDMPQDDYERQSREVQYGTDRMYEGINPKISKGELQEMISGKKQPKILKTIKVKDIK